MTQNPTFHAKINEIINNSRPKMTYYEAVKELHRRKKIKNSKAAPPNPSPAQYREKLEQMKLF